MDNRVPNERSTSLLSFLYDEPVYHIGMFIKVLTDTGYSSIFVFLAHVKKSWWVHKEIFSIGPMSSYLNLIETTRGVQLCLV